MCLSAVTSKRKCAKELEIREDGYVWLWKVFGVMADESLTGQFKHYKFYEGLNTAHHKVIRSLNGSREYLQYPSGFHCFTNERDAKWWIKNSNWLCALGCERVVVPVKVKKAWITAVGQQSDNQVVVCKHIII